MAASGHRWREFGDQQERGADVDGERSVDVLDRRGRGEPADREQAGVIDQDVDVPVAEFDGAACQGSNSEWVAKLAEHHLGVAARRADRGDDLLAAILVPAVDECPRAASSQDTCCRSPDPAGRSGDKGDQADQIVEPG